MKITNAPTSRIEFEGIIPSSDFPGEMLVFSEAASNQDGIGIVLFGAVTSFRIGPRVVKVAGAASPLPGYAAQLDLDQATCYDARIGDVKSLWAYMQAGQVTEAIVSWGDGASESVLPSALSSVLTHQYAEEDGTYSVSVQVVFSTPTGPGPSWSRGVGATFDQADVFVTA